MNYPELIYKRLKTLDQLILVTLKTGRGLFKKSPRLVKNMPPIMDSFIKESMLLSKNAHVNIGEIGA